MSASIGSGKAISALPFSRPRTMRRAASSASIMNGVGNVFFAVRSVRTNPGQMVWTEIPSGRRSIRSDSSM